MSVRISSGFIAISVCSGEERRRCSPRPPPPHLPGPSGIIRIVCSLDRLQPDEHGGGAATLTAQAVVLGNQMHIVRAFEPSMGHAEGIEERLAVADHGVTRLL